MCTHWSQIQYAGMSHFEERYEDFLVDATILRRRFMPDGAPAAVTGLRAGLRSSKGGWID